MRTKLNSTCNILGGHVLVGGLGTVAETVTKLCK